MGKIDLFCRKKGSELNVPNCILAPQTRPSALGHLRPLARRLEHQRRKNGGNKPRTAATGTERRRWFASEGRMVGEVGGPIKQVARPQPKGEALGAAVSATAESSTHAVSRMLWQHAQHAHTAPPVFNGLTMYG
jgi:hypothetical protein